jgi:hypothetical protein
VARLIQQGAPAGMIQAARRELAAANLRRLVAVERARQGLPAPSSDLEVLGFVAGLLTREAALWRGTRRWRRDGGTCAARDQGHDLPGLRAAGAERAAVPAVREPFGGRDASGPSGHPQCPVGARGTAGQPVNGAVTKAMVMDAAGRVGEAIERTQRAIDRIAEQDRVREEAEARRVAGLRARAAAVPARPQYTAADVAKVRMALGIIAQAEARWLERLRRESEGNRCRS